MPRGIPNKRTKLVFKPSEADTSSSFIGDALRRLQCRAGELAGAIGVSPKEFQEYIDHGRCPILVARAVNGILAEAQLPTSTLRGSASTKKASFLAKIPAKHVPLVKLAVGTLGGTLHSLDVSE